MPSGWKPGRRKVAKLHVSIAEKIAEARTTMTIDRPHQQRDRIAGGGEQGGVEEEAPPHRIGDPGQRAQEEIARPAGRLENPEGAVLVGEEGLLAEPQGLPGPFRPFLGGPRRGGGLDRVR
jgi:hypothetical protein